MKKCLFLMMAILTSCQSSKGFLVPPPVSAMNHVCVEPIVPESASYVSEKRTFEDEPRQEYDISLFITESTNLEHVYKFVDVLEGYDSYTSITVNYKGHNVDTVAHRVTFHKDINSRAYRGKDNYAILNQPPPNDGTFNLAWTEYNARVEIHEIFHWLYNMSHEQLHYARADEGVVIDTQEVYARLVEEYGNSKASVDAMLINAAKPDKYLLSDKINFNSIMYYWLANWMFKGKNHIGGGINNIEPSRGDSLYLQKYWGIDKEAIFEKYPWLLEDLYNNAGKPYGKKIETAVEYTFGFYAYILVNDEELYRDDGTWSCGKGVDCIGHYGLLTKGKKRLAYDINHPSRYETKIKGLNYKMWKQLQDFLKEHGYPNVSISENAPEIRA